jgi:predicted dehydrogenase
MTRPKPATRRTFLKQAAAAAGGAFAVPLFVPGRALGLADAAAPSERIRYGVVSCGSHARDWNVPQIFRIPDAEIVAICDVDQNHMAIVKDRVEKKYGKGVATTGDFREIVNRKDIDVVYNGTPDHWHVIPSIMAMKAGKDCLCEKPLTLTVAEGQALVAVAKQTNRVTQVGSENRSIDQYIKLVELVRNGRIGKLQHIRVSIPAGHSIPDPKPEKLLVKPVPPYLDYEMWQGQAPAAPYCEGRVHWNFRWNLAYSGGMITDWGAHMIDIAQWGNDTEKTGPVEVEGKGQWPAKDALYNTATTFDLNYRYANGVTMNLVSKGPGIRFEGTEGWVECQGWRAGIKASKPEIAEDLGPDAKQVYRPIEIVKAGDGGKGGEHTNFVDCVKKRKPCYGPFETGHRTITIAHIANCAMLLGRKLKWDPEKERFDGDEEANAMPMIDRKQREPWTIANIDSWIKKNG